MTLFRSSIFVLAFALAGIQNSFAIEVYFTPSDACENKIEAAIKGAKLQLDVAVYAINNAKIVAALKDAYKRGVKVRILTDNLQANGRSSRVLELSQAGLNLRVHSKHKIMHMKVAVFDGKNVVTGSFNWTQPASKENAENCVFMNEEAAVSAFSKRFEELWVLNSAEKSKVKLARILSKKSSRLPASE